MYVQSLYTNLRFVFAMYFSPWIEFVCAKYVIQNIYTKHLEEKINYYNRNRNKKILKFRYLN